APLTVTVNGPVVAPVGTVATICVSLQLLTAATVPLKVTVELPWLAWKPDPVSVTWVPTVPPTGAMLLTLGAGTVNMLSLLLLTLLTTTFTAPVAAVTGTVATTAESLQLEIDAAGWLLKVRALAPCVAPKPRPVTVTWVPTGPVEGDRLDTTRLGTV